VTPKYLQKVRPVTKDEVRKALWAAIQAKLPALRFQKEPERRMCERVLAVFGVERLKDLPEAKRGELVAFCAGIRWLCEGERDYEEQTEAARQRRELRNYGGKNWGQPENLRALRREIFEPAAPARDGPAKRD
jgi:hypothetical protein